MMNRKIIFLVSFLISMTFISITNASLTPIENQIRNNIIQNQDNALELLKKLVNINSGTTNLSGIKKVRNIVRAEFEKLGFKTQWIEEPAQMRRAGMLLAKKEGNHGKHVLLIAHLDTVFPPESPFQYFERKGNIGIGPGVTDDKGGMIVILSALKALQAVHALEDATVYVALTGDEEDSGKPTTISRKALIDIAKKSDVALDFEASLGKNTATIARRGISDWIIETHGKEAHSSLIFKNDIGDGALFELARILNTLRTSLIGERYLTINPGITLGGTEVHYSKNTSEGRVLGKSNVIASTAMARGDLRFLTAEQEQSAKNKMLKIVAKNLPGTSAAITFEEGIPGMPPTSANKELLKKYSDISINLGYGAVLPIDPGERGAGDISHVASYVPANLAGLGTTGTGIHSEKETLDIDSIKVNAERAAILIYRLTSLPS